MKLYSGDLSPYSARVRMQIYAKGLRDIAIEWPQDFPTPAFAAKYPLARIPILELDDGGAIAESGVITQYLEETFPTPSLLGADARENALIRTLEHIGDIYIMNNMFLVTPQSRRSTRDEGVRDLLAGQAIRGVEALERMIGERGFACLGRLTLADCAIVPGLFLIEAVLPTVDEADPIPRLPKVAAYWAAMQRHEIGAHVIGEMRRGREERIAQIRAASQAAKARG